MIVFWLTGVLMASSVIAWTAFALIVCPVITLARRFRRVRPSRDHTPFWLA